MKVSIPIPAPLYNSGLVHRSESGQLSVEVDPESVRELIARPADWRKLAKPEEVGLSGAHTIIVCEPGPIVLSRLPHFVCTRLSLCEVAGILWPQGDRRYAQARDERDALVVELNAARASSMKHLREGAEVAEERDRALLERNAARYEREVNARDRDGYRDASEPVPEGPPKASPWEWRENLAAGEYHRVGQGDATVCGISLRSASKWRVVGEGEAVDRAKVCDRCATLADLVSKHGFVGAAIVEAAEQGGVQICQHQPVSLPDGTKFCAKCGRTLPAA